MLFQDMPNKNYQDDFFLIIANVLGKMKSPSLRHYEIINTLHLSYEKKIIKGSSFTQH